MSSGPPKKPLKVQPRAAVRKSKQERDALEAQEARSRRERQQDAAAEASAEQQNERQRYGGRGGEGARRGGDRAPNMVMRDIARPHRGSRGGFMGQTNRDARPAAGSSSSSSKRPGRGRGRTAEDDEDVGDADMGSSAPAPTRTRASLATEVTATMPQLPRTVSIKQEDPSEGFVESVDELGTGIDIENLDTISISSGEADNEMTDVDSGGRLPTMTPGLSRRMLLPVRLRRTEHVERQIGMNTDVSSETLAQPRRRGKRASSGRQQPVAPDITDRMDLDASAIDETTTTAEPKARRRKVRSPRNEEERERLIMQEERDTLYHELAELAPGEREGNIYLFQLPPKLPELIPATNLVKKERSATQSPEQTRATLAHSPEITTIKDEEDLQTPMLQGRPKLPSGKVGTLRVYPGGRTKLMWGDVNMTLGMGMDAHFLQTVVHLDPQSNATGRGSVTSMGQIRGKFIVTPDWDEIFAADKQRKQ